MTATFDPALVDAFLAHHWRFRPVDATFMGARGYDDRLPPAGADTLALELAELSELDRKIAACAEPDDLGHRLDRKTMLAELAIRKASATVRSRLINPAWYSGEAAFGIISLLLPQSAPVDHAAVASRLGAIDGFLSDGLERLAGQAVPRGWVARARQEATAMADFLRADIRLHDEHRRDWDEPASAAADAFERFFAALVDIPDADPACGEEYLALVMHTVHGLDLTPRDALALAEQAFARAGHELKRMALAIDPSRTWQQIVAALSQKHPPDSDAIVASYRDLDRAAMIAGTALVTPASDYALDYRWMTPCFRKVSQDLYFLFYRSPPALRAGKESVYWVMPAGVDQGAFLRSNATAMVKTVHAVHHGSIGHHTQNARARGARSRLARVAGTDCALGLACLGAGTLIEGWACYVEDLLIEAPGFYDPEEILLLKQFERRNAASVLVDINLHLGTWSVDDAMAFYRDEAGFAAARVEAEVIRNSLFPGSRLMYWLGVEGIKQLRQRWKGDTRSFHDGLLSYGHVPLAWIGEEMARQGQLTG